MITERYKPKDTRETTPRVESFDAVGVGIAVAEPIDRMAIEQHIEDHAESEIETSERLEEVRQEIGLERDEDREITIRAEALLKKLEIPFDDEGVDKKRRELLEKARKDIETNLKKLMEIADGISSGRREGERLAGAIRESEAQRAYCENELARLRKEAEEYIDKTKPPIIRKSTKEKLARAEGVIQYSREREFAREHRVSGLGFTYNKSDKYRESARGGFEDAKSSGDGIDRFEGHLGREVSQAKAGEIEMSQLEESQTKTLARLEDIVRIYGDELESLKPLQEWADERKERLRVIKELFESLLPQMMDEPAKPDPLIAERQKVTQERSEGNILRYMDEFLVWAEEGRLVNIGIKNETEGIGRLREEVKRVQESASVTINLSGDRLPAILKDGRFKSTLELPWKEKSVKGARDTTAYERDRIETEKSLGIYTQGTEEDPYTIVGSLASDNGYDEFYGGANSYGDVFVRLKPSAMDRSIFVNGDSVHEVARHGDSSIKPGLGKEAAMIAKAIRNIDKDGMLIQGIAHLKVIEAGILGGVKMDDIESINFRSPIRILEEYDQKIKEANAHPPGRGRERLKEVAKELRDSYESTRRCLENTRAKFPQYAHLIKEV